MKILLINPPPQHEFALFVLDDYNEKARSAQPPLGLQYLKSYLDPYHDVNILDMNVKNISIEKINEYIKDVDLIGITCVIAKWITVKKLCEEIRKYTLSIPIVLGGVNPSLYPYETLAGCPEIDYVISGFGQEHFKTLCENIEKNPNYIYNNIYNCHTRSNTNRKTIGKFQFVDLDQFPCPNRESLPVENYTMPYMPDNPTTSMLTSVGCPFFCKFCACKNFQPVKLRYPDKIVQEMLECQNLGIKSILFQDELFTMSKRRIKNICSEINYNNIKLNWSIRSRANLVNEESINMMAEAGCCNIHLGIESGTDRILEKMGKGIDIKTIQKSVEIIKKSSLKVSASFMLGYPTETEKEILETIQFAKNIELDSVQFYLTQPEPHTELYEDVQTFKNLPDDIYREFTLSPENIDLSNNIASDIFTKEQLQNFMKFAYSETKNLYKIQNEMILKIIKGQEKGANIF